MSQSLTTDDRREHPWHAFIVPTARGLEGFVWRVAWFALLVKILLFT